MRLRALENGRVGGCVTSSRLGLTLIEVLIATTLTLLMMLALAQGFKTMSDSITAGRSRLTMADQLRGITNLLRNDLDGRTTDGTTPQNSNNANGYFFYYDGPLSDSSAMLFSYNKSASTVEAKLSASRWGDIDDVLMFTTRSKPGEWFRGKVPLALLIMHSINSGLFPGGSVPAITASDWFTDVSIASEYAEVAWFTRPLNDNGSIDIAELPPGYADLPIGTPVADNGGADLDGDGIVDPDGMPDNLALCRRVLLIRPDLNISNTPAIAGLGTTDPQLSMQPLPLSAARMTSADYFRYMMRFAYQRADLSVRPILINGNLTLATNSLADLQRPENRFAHYTIPGTVFGSPSDSTSMPILALTSEATSTGNYLSLLGRSLDTLGGVAAMPVDRGFIPSSFCRTQIIGSGGVIVGVLPTLNEVVASNITAFDVKGFDTSAQLLASKGADNIWGVTDSVAEFGTPGTDDEAVSPSDPAYARILFDSKTNGTPIVIAGQGAFVDLGWAIKVMNQRDSFTSSGPVLELDSGVSAPGLKSKYFSTSGSTAFPGVWGSSLSGIDPTGVFAVAVNPSSSLFNSGRVVANGGSFAVFQPCFDTFTDAYESDGDLQETVIIGGQYEKIWNGGMKRFGHAGPTTLSMEPDRGTNGLDDNGNSLVDEAAEKETSPPIAISLPSIQVTIRLQDRTAGMLQQLSVIESLVD